MKKVIIVGGGLSGIYLASLLEKGYEVTILEARERIGGRIFSIDSHDLGPSWIWSHQRNILELVDSLDLELFRQYSDGSALYDTQGRVERFNTPASAPSFRMKGSLSKLVNAIKNTLKNTEIFFNQEVVAIEEKENRVYISTKQDNYEVDYLISTLAPRLATQLAFKPKLPEHLLSQMLQTPTWMGNSAKCVIEFKSAFWREHALSGFVFSNLGPLGEIHDASLENKSALFGFISLHANMQKIKEDVTKQLLRVFKIDEDEILNIYIVDWKQEVYSAVKQDSIPLSSHPQYGIDTSAYSDRILFSSTEFSYEEGGYLEGAIINAKKIASQLL